jgi:2-polyprenyl-3-methyl-5-hydroxy-6-metoxy-1,4-benzoquinol methylase
MTTLDSNKVREMSSAEASMDSRHANYKPFGPEWGSAYFTKWATIAYAIYELGIAPGASILDVGAGGGWTTLFLAESGFVATGTDVAPANVSVGRRRAERYHSDARFITADMDTMDLGELFDAALVFDALHHTSRRREAVRRIAGHVRPGGWILFGEPSWLHTISPHARRTSSETGWIENGISVRGLRADCRRAGLTQFRRFYEGTAPTHTVKGFAWQTARHLAGRLAVAPQTSIWLAARSLD